MLNKILSQEKNLVLVSQIKETEHFSQKKNGKKEKRNRTLIDNNSVLKKKEKRTSHNHAHLCDY